jgi:hypothetical protein
MVKWVDGEMGHGEMGKWQNRKWRNGNFEWRNGNNPFQDVLALYSGLVFKYAVKITRPPVFFVAPQSDELYNCVRKCLDKRN